MMTSRHSRCKLQKHAATNWNWSCTGLIKMQFLLHFLVALRCQLIDA